MAHKTIPMGMVGNALNEVLERHSEITKAKASQAIRIAIVKTWGAVIEETPVDEGRARGNWFVTAGSPATGTGSKKKNKGANYVMRSTGRDMFATKWYLTNNLPYIRKLEFGGFTDKPSTEKTINGYSRLAPRGMLRRNLLKWRSTLRKSFVGVMK